MKIRSLLLVAAFLVIASIAQANVTYSIRELPPLPGHLWASCLSLSNTGYVLGLSNDPDYNYHFVEWSSGGSVTPLGYEAWAINNLNQTAGRDSGMTAIRDSNGNTLAAYENGVPERINDLGAVLGTEYTSDRTGLCYWAPDGTKYNIDLLPELNNRVSLDMNNKGQVVGFCHNDAGSMHYGFTWSVETGLVDIAAVTGSDIFEPLAINDNGVIVGGMLDGLNIEGVAVWSSEEGIRMLEALPGALGSRAQDINNRGQIVGHDNIGAIIWGSDGKAERLNALAEGKWACADMINDNGVIAGASQRDNGFITAVVWEPVPEPASILGLSSGLMGCWMCIRRRKAGIRHT